MYNTPEERALIEAVSGNTHVPASVVGVGSEVPDTASGDRARHHPGIDLVGQQLQPGHVGAGPAEPGQGA